MFTEDFYTYSDETYLFSRQQGSDFAKRIAGDFNPLHDTDNSRFCVPGDLLFSVILSKYGVSKNMSFDFQGMIAGDMPIKLIESNGRLNAVNEKQKNVISVEKAGEVETDQDFVEGLIRSYVAFSGKTFPHIIIELMKKEGSMINTRRPMVIYDQMKLSFTQFSKQAPVVELKDCDFEVTGKRGMVTMNFDIRAENRSIGSGEKQIIMSGLRPYLQPEIDYLVDAYNASRQSYSE
ncbi:MAG: DUF3581 domain-containing protein [Kangiellaceae bacterium]|nr:DUF3581 domain-containing protein [Kangiellaceae bacterium]